MAVPEMSRYLRQIVDNSFEEGQFESAVAMLDQLRSAVHKPTVIHILHLVFIALHPVHESQLNDSEPQLDAKTLLLQSPRKIIKQTKASLILSAQAVIAAQQLLLSLLETTPLDTLGSALPAYPETKNEPLMEFEFSESMIFKQAAAIKHSKNCWEILKSSFKARTTHLMSTPKAQSKQPSRIRFMEPSYSDLSEEHIKLVGDDSWFVLEWLVALFEKDAEMAVKQGQQRHSPLLLKQLPPPPIGSSARWDASEPLKLIFYAFQQPDIRRQHSGTRLLNLLIDLTQTPYLNLPSFVSAVLAQLTTTTTPTTDPSSSSTTPNTPSSQFTTLFAHLSSEPAALSFKLALCRKMIEDAAADASSTADSRRTSPQMGAPSQSAPDNLGMTTRHGGQRLSGGGGSASGSSGGGGILKKPQPRAQPRPRVRGGALTAESSLASIDGNTTALTRASSLSTVTSTLSSTTAAGTTGPSIPPPTYIARLPTHPALLQLLTTRFPFFTFRHQGAPQSPRNHLPNKPWATPTLLLRVKFELLLAYALVQSLRREAVEAASGRKPASTAQRLDGPDDAFVRSVADGSLGALIDELFAPEGGNEDEERVLYKDVIRAVVGLPAGDGDGDLVMG